MSSFWLAFNVVFPLLIYMVVGGFIRKCGILSRASLEQINNMIFRLLIPLSLFFDISGADLKTAVRPELFALVAGSITLVSVVTWVTVYRLVAEKRDAATIVQGVFRSNYVLFGTAISYSLCGEAGTAVTAALAIVVSPLFNILAVILFETMRGSGVKPGKMLLQILKNPLVDAGLLGVVFNLLGLRVLAVLAEPLMKLGGIATPLALVTLGGLLSFESMVSHKGYLSWAVLGRLVIVPVIALSAFIAMGYRNELLVAILAVFASPTAVASAPMAQSMGGNGALAGEIVALSSVGSLLTMFVYIFFLSGMGFI